MDKKYECENCKDEGHLTKVEWAEVDGKDMDWEVEVPCPICSGE